MADVSTDLRAPVPRLHLVTDDATFARSEFQRVAATLLTIGGERIGLHLRAPTTPGRLLYERLHALLPHALHSGSTLLVNDRADIARTAEKVGVHLRARSMPTVEVRRWMGARRLIGRSIHDPKEIEDGRDDPVDYYMVGTIYRTPSHPEHDGAGPPRIREAALRATRPCVAIGGVTPERVEELLEVGAHGVAVLGGVWNTERPDRALHRYLERLPG